MFESNFTNVVASTGPRTEAANSARPSTPCATD